VLEIKLFLAFSSIFPNMNLEELRTFIAIVETKSLVAASRRLHVTQSTVTARMNSLEEEIGQKLLHRSKAGAELTSSGFKFQRYAELMIQLWRQARHEVSLPTGFSGVCNIGVEFDLWPDVAQTFIDHIQSADLRIAAAAWPAEQMQLRRWLHMGLIDLAFCFNPQPEENFSSRALLDDELVLVSSSGPDDGSLGPQYIFVDHGEEFRRQHAEAFPSYVGGLTLAAASWALQRVMERGGSGYLSRRHAGPMLRDGRLFEVPTAPRFKRRVYVVESVQTVRQWPWYEGAMATLFDRALK
jgi:LysR family transcriptional regulator, flagellar master operon regulator